MCAIWCVVGVIVIMYIMCMCCCVTCVVCVLGSFMCCDLRLLCVDVLCCAYCWGIFACLWVVSLCGWLRWVVVYIVCGCVIYVAMHVFVYVCDCCMLCY